MQFVSVEISLIAVLPALLLCWYIYEKDRVEKEPLGLLSVLFFAGGIGFIPAYFAQRGVASLIDRLFAAHFSVSVEGAVLFESTAEQLLHTALFAFGGVALAENVIKWLLLVCITRKNRHFNSLFDGLIYACFVSLGFAAFESVAYAWQNGWDTLLLRLVSAIPCHLLIGVLMGYGYTLWHTVHSAKAIERRLVQDGVLPAPKIRGTKRLLVGSLVIPFLVQGIFFLSGAFHSTLIDALFYIAVGILFALCFMGIHLLSDKDKPTAKTSFILLARKHPTADADLLREATEVPYER